MQSCMSWSGFLKDRFTCDKQCHSKQGWHDGLVARVAEIVVAHAHFNVPQVVPLQEKETKFWQMLEPWREICFYQEKFKFPVHVIQMQFLQPFQQLTFHVEIKTLEDVKVEGDFWENVIDIIQPVQVSRDAIAQIKLFPVA